MDNESLYLKYFASLDANVIRRVKQLLPTFRARNPRGTNLKFKYGSAVQLLKPAFPELAPAQVLSLAAFLVMMAAANDTDSDLQAIMAGVQSQTAAKQALRTLIANVGRDVANNTAQQTTDAGGNPILPLPPAAFPGMPAYLL